MIPREQVGGVSDEPLFEEAKKDIIVQEPSGWSVYSEGQPRKHLGGPYPNKARALQRLKQIEHYKAIGKDAYVPPPGPGTAGGNHPSIEPTKQRAKPDPNTRPDPSWYPARMDAKGRKRLPKQMPPTRLEEDYAKKLVKIIAPMKAAWAPVVKALPSILKKADTRKDADDTTATLRSLLTEATRKMGQVVKPSVVSADAKKHALIVAKYQKAQLTRQAQAAIGVDPLFKDKHLVARIDQFAHENATLITRIPRELHDDLSVMITRGVSSGKNPTSLGHQISQRFGIAERHARLIARDQTLKMYGDVNHMRQRELGINRFTWRTTGDERVREEHAELEDEEFDYDEPPDIDGEPTLPSEAVMCRCYADPIFDTGDDDEEDEETDDDDTESGESDDSDSDEDTED